MQAPTKKLHEREFIALVAMLFASVAFSIDAMLPALSTIGEELSPADPSRAALVVGIDLCPKFPPALHGVLGVKSLALGRHLVHRLSMQKFHRCQVAQC